MVSVMNETIKPDRVDEQQDKNIPYTESEFQRNITNDIVNWNIWLILKKILTIRTNQRKMRDVK